MRSTSANSGDRPLELAALQGLQHVLVGHRRQAEARAAVAEVATVVDLVVAVEGRALRPRPPVRRDSGDRPPPRALERRGEREAIVLDELVVPALAVDPHPRLQGGVRQPAEAAEGRRGEEARCARRSRGLQLRGALVEHGADPGGSGPRRRRSSRRRRAGHPCRAGWSAAGRREWRRSGRARSRGRGPRDPAGRPAPPAPRRRRGRRRSRRRPACRGRAGPPRRRRAPRPPGAPSRGGRPRPA